MEKERIERQIKQMIAARQIFALAMEDLKNVQAFRESKAGAEFNRRIVLDAMDDIIYHAERMIR